MLPESHLMAHALTWRYLAGLRHRALPVPFGPAHFTTLLFGDELGAKFLAAQDAAIRHRDPVAGLDSHIPVTPSSTRMTCIPLWPVTNAVNGRTRMAALQVRSSAPMPLLADRTHVTSRLAMQPTSYFDQLPNSSVKAPIRKWLERSLQIERENAQMIGLIGTVLHHATTWLQVCKWWPAFGEFAIGLAKLSASPHTSGVRSNLLRFHGVVMAHVRDMDSSDTAGRARSLQDSDLRHALAHHAGPATGTLAQCRMLLDTKDVVESGNAGPEVKAAHMRDMVFEPGGTRVIIHTDGSTISTGVPSPAVNQSAAYGVTSFFDK